MIMFKPAGVISSHSELHTHTHTLILPYEHADCYFGTVSSIVTLSDMMDGFPRSSWLLSSSAQVTDADAGLAAEQMCRAGRETQT